VKGQEEAQSVGDGKEQGGIEERIERQGEGIGHERLPREDEGVPKGKLAQEEMVLQVGHENTVDVDQVVVKETLPQE